LSTSWLARVAEQLGPATDLRPLGGAATAFTSAGRRLVAKTGTGALDEAAGLRTLGSVEGAPPVPEVVLVEDGLLVTAFVPQATRRVTLEERLGRSLARLHLAPAAGFGGGSSFVGDCRVDPSPAPSAAAFYRARLVELARRCGLERVVAPVAERLDDLLEPAAPSMVHGDLWWGNIIWGLDGDTWLIDPSVHGGHPEEDLAMLGLFGAIPERLRAAYAELRPLDAGVALRRPLFELVPLLVHAVLFGGSYLRQAEETARGLARA
jgi:fructosamine-3-kinase